MSEDYPGVELSDELIEHFRDTFDSFDLDEDGIVTYEELMTVSNRLGYCMSVDVVAVSGALFIPHRKLYGSVFFQRSKADGVHGLPRDQYDAEADRTVSEKIRMLRFRS